MCEIMEKYMSEAEKKGQEQERIRAICKLMSKGFDKTVIMDLDYTEAEYEEAEEALLATVS